MKNSSKYKLIALLQTLAVPLVVFVVMSAIDYAVTGSGLISSSVDLKGFMRSLITWFAFAMALNVNLSCGRMDLSLGAQMYMGCILGGNFAMSLGFGGIGIILVSMVVGAACGLIVGLLFVNLKILPMVLGLGCTLVYECISYACYNSQGLMLYGKQGTDILSNVSFIIAVVVILVIAMTIILQISAFGYRRRAIQGSQRLASDAGINVFSNCLVCYALAGALVALAGVFTTAYSGSLTPVLGMSSNGKVFSNMFPMMLGSWVAGFLGNQSIGVLAGSCSVYFLKAGLSKLGLDDLTSTIFVYGAWLLFLIYLNNKDVVSYNKKRKQRKAESQQMRAALLAAKV